MLSNRRLLHHTMPLRSEGTTQEGTGNVFADLGLPNSEERLAKALLSRAIHKAIEAQGLTQTQAAKRLGCAQPDVSNIVRGNVSGFAIERLARYLGALGFDVEIRVRPTDEQNERGHLLVAAG